MSGARCAVMVPLLLSNVATAARRVIQIDRSKTRQRTAGVDGQNAVQDGNRVHDVEDAAVELDLSATINRDVVRRNSRRAATDNKVGSWRRLIAPTRPR